jgi:predicted ABC-type ATPase
VLTEEDKTKLAKEGGEAILAPFTSGVTSQQLTLQELKQLGDKTEIMTNITDEMIAEADDKPQPPIEVEQGEARAGTAEFEESGGSKGKDSAFRESDHPRDEGGKFSVTSGKSTEEHFKTASGEYTPERQKLHSQITNTLVSGKTKSSNPTAYVLGGGSASGKSTGFKRMVSERFKNEIMTIDSDAIKEMIPEYEALKKANPEKAAALVHEESSHLAKQAMALATAKNIDFVYDSTGSGKGLPKVAERLKNEGYKVHAMYFDIPIDEARKRAEARAAKTGRHIPEDVIQGSHRGSASGFMKLKEDPNIESAKLYSNIERIPALVYTRSGTEKGLVVDENAWKLYQEKAGA